MLVSLLQFFFFLQPMSFLGCKSLCIVKSFLALLSFCCSSLVYFKNSTEYLTRRTAWVLIFLMKFLLYTSVSSSFLLLLRYFFFYKTPQNSKRRLCGDREELITHIINTYSNLAQKIYRPSVGCVRDPLGIVQEFKFDHTKKWCTQKPGIPPRESDAQNSLEFCDTNG